MITVIVILTILVGWVLITTTVLIFTCMCSSQFSQSMGVEEEYPEAEHPLSQERTSKAETKASIYI